MKTPPNELKTETWLRRHMSTISALRIDWQSRLFRLEIYFDNPTGIFLGLVWHDMCSGRIGRMGPACVR